MAGLDDEDAGGLLFVTSLLTLRMATEWTLAQFVGYLTTWSAVQRARAQGVDPIPAITEELRAGWPLDDTPRRIEWPLSMRVGHV